MAAYIDLSTLSPASETDTMSTVVALTSALSSQVSCGHTSMSQTSTEITTGPQTHNRYLDQCCEMEGLDAASSHADDEMIHRHILFETVCDDGPH